MKPTILMLEHDEDDRYITQEILTEIKSNIAIQFVQNSDQFLDYLKRADGVKTAIPALALLDYRSTPLIATEIVRRIRKDKKYSHLPVVILSGTANEEIVMECYKAGANSFVVKPFTGEMTASKISSFVRYWFETAELPKTE